MKISRFILLFLTYQLAGQTDFLPIYRQYFTFNLTIESQINSLPPLFESQAASNHFTIKRYRPFHSEQDLHSKVNFKSPLPSRCEYVFYFAMQILVPHLFSYNKRIPDQIYRGRILQAKIMRPLHKD